MARKTMADIMNARTYQNYYNRLANHALSVFEWSDLPESVNARFLEFTLFNEGQIAFVNDPLLGYLALPVTIAGELNVYGEPVEYHVLSIGYSKTFKASEAVIIWNNLMRTATEPVIADYATRLYEVERTLDVNIKGQKTPVLIKATQQQRLTLLNLYAKYDGNEPFIFGSNDLDLDGVFEAINTQAPFVSDKLMLYKHDIWNEAMGFLGINNANQDKKERLVEAEVSANDEQIETAKEIMLKERRNACEQINKMFGLNISVDYKLNIAAKEREENQDGIDRGNANQRAND